MKLRWKHVKLCPDRCVCSRWRHQMETFSALLALCAGNSPVSGEFPAQRPATRSVDVSFDLHLNKRLSKQSWGWWFETPLRSLWRHRNGWPCAFRYTAGTVMTNIGFSVYTEQYRQVSNIIRTKSQQSQDSHTVLRLSLPNPLKSDIKSRMKM